MTLFDRLRGQRRFIYLLTALLSAAGVGALVRLPSAIYPELRFPQVTVIAQGSVLGARQVAFSITRPLEEAVSTVPGVARVRSKSIRGASELSIYFNPDADMDRALQAVQARVNSAGSDLPAGLELEVERITPSLFPILSYNLEGGDPAVLYDIARYSVKPILSRIPGVGRVEVQGSAPREIEVVAEPVRLAAQGLTYDELAAAIRASITPAAVGRVARDYRQYLIVTDTEARTLEDIGAVPLPGGLSVRDVATVRFGTVDRVRLVAGDGRPAALVNISRQVGGNLVAIADSVAHAMAALTRTLPPGVRVVPVYDQASLVRDAVSSVRDAMLIGAGLAVLILLLFLRHVRITLISAASIPLTLIITVAVMPLFGQTFNLMTLGAMAIAIGLVIDDAVVITENIVRHLRPGVERAGAIRLAVEELLGPVTTSTLTTVIVFLPLGLLTGVAGQFFAALSITLTIAVLVSLGLAVTIIPLLAEQFLRDRDADPPAAPAAPESGVASSSPGPSRSASFGDALGARYERSLASVLPHPGRVTLAALLLVGAGLLAQHFVGTGFLPDMDEGSFVVDYVTPGGTSLDETDRQVRIAERILAETPEVLSSSRRTGAEMGFFATQQNTGDIVARLKPRRDRRRSSFAVIDDVRDRIRAAIPRLRIEFIQILSDVINDLSGNARPLELKLFGSSLDSLESYARRLEPALAAVPGIEDLYNGVAEPNAEMRMHIDAAEATRIGLDPARLAQLAQGALLGVPAGEVRDGDRSMGVRVRAPDAVRYDPEQLAALPMLGAGGNPAPFGALMSLTPQDARSELLRENQQQLIALTGDVAGRSLGGVMRDVRAVLTRNPPPRGIRIELGGQYASQQEAFRALLMVLGLAIIGVIAIMVVQFQSFLEPLIIVTAAPVSFVGAVGLLLVTGTPFNVSSFMGLILLVGLIVKNGIILLEFAGHRQRAGGLTLEAAIREAARVRLRPILMTTLCTLFGLLPLALGLGAGSEAQRPLALAVIGGLSLSTLVTLYVVPTWLVALRREPGSAPPAPARIPA